MAFRVLTGQYQTYRLQFLKTRPNQHTFDDDDDRIDIELGDVDSEISSGQETRQPKWMYLFNEVQEDINEIKKRMSVLRKLHEEHATPRFGKDFVQEEHEIEMETQYIKKLFKKCVDTITIIGGDNDEIPSSQDEKMRQNVKTSLITEVNELGKQFRNDQRLYIQKLKTIKERKKSIGVSYDDTTDLEPEEKKRLEEIQQQLYQKNLTEDQIRTILENEREILERDRELSQILTSVIELQDMFHEFQQLVIEQGTLLDRIDYNLENTKYTVRQAHKDLVAAEKYQKCSRMTLCLIFLVIVVFGIGIAIALKLFLKFNPIFKI